MIIIEKDSIEIAFVILHYMAIKDTFECVDSIKKNCGTSNYKIIIIDNASPDRSGEELKIKYQENKNIKVIICNKNMGFAKGNNIGIDYARKYWTPKFVVVMNNDTCLMQDNFIDSINLIYKDTKFAALGPLIVNRNAKCCSNPKRMKVLEKEDIIKIQKNLKRDQWMLRMHIYKLINYYFRSIWRIIRKKVDTYQCIYRPMENVELHGSFLVFSPIFFQKLNGFDSRTFMYFEEDILFLHMQKNNLKTVYHPGVVIYHKEDASTDLSIGDSRIKKFFTIRNNLKSTKIYLDVLAEYENKK